MHLAQLEGHLILMVQLGGFKKHGGDVLLHLGEHHPRVALALGSGLGGHGLLQLLRNHDVADLHEQDGNAPGARLFLDGPAQLVVQLHAAHGHVGHVLASDGVAQGRLGRHGHRIVVVLHFHAGLLRIPHHPEQYRVDIHGHEIGRQGALGTERGGDDALVDADGPVFQNGNGGVETRSHHTVQLAKPQHDHLFPAQSDVQRRRGRERRH